MCCTEKDEELWNTDPHEYIRSKFGIFLNIFLFFYIIRICCVRLHNNSIDLKFITSYKFYILSAVSLAETGVDPVDNWSLLSPSQNSIL